MVTQDTLAAATARCATTSSTAAPMPPRKNCTPPPSRRGRRLHRHPDRPQGRRGYEAHVGERGVKLSGGQRQRGHCPRHAQRRAHPAAGRSHQRAGFGSGSRHPAKPGRPHAGKTVIAIAHRLSTIAAMDRLIVMDGGRIVEEGHPRPVAGQGRHLCAPVGAPERGLSGRGAAQRGLEPGAQRPASAQAYRGHHFTLSDTNRRQPAPASTWAGRCGPKSCPTTRRRTCGW